MESTQKKQKITGGATPRARYPPGNKPHISPYDINECLSLPFDALAMDRFFTFAHTFLLLSVALALAFSACRKDEAIEDNPSAMLEFSTDSIVFDTVFTTVGSVTKYLKVYNNNAKKINISSARLAGGGDSFYRINIDGNPSIYETNIGIPSGDSIFVFIRVTIDPNSNLTPFVVTDRLIFETNTNIQDVDLVSWGQNANYIIADQHIEGLPPFRIVAGTNSDTTWTNELPFLIYGYAVIDSGARLTISAGTRIYFHNNSGLWVYRGGQLKVMGTAGEPVLFRGDRLEDFYDDIPGQWDRIWINEGSTGNEIHYAVIKNGFIGLQTETLGLQQPLENHLLLTNTIIENMSGAGILSRFYNITGINTVVANCGEYGVALTRGGKYDFRQCTFANYWSGSVRQTQNLILTNSFRDQDNNLYVFEMDAYFGNCINYGNQEEELYLSVVSGAPFHYVFDHCLLKTDSTELNPVSFPGTFKNEDPLFAGIEQNDYHPDTLSPVIGAGSPDVINTSPYLNILQYDLDGNSRSGNPDLGAYEFVPNGL